MFQGQDSDDIEHGHGMLDFPKIRDGCDASSGQNVEDVEGDHGLEGDGLGATSFEKVLEAMGAPGRFQVIQSLMINVHLIPVVFIGTSFVFIGHQPSFSCFLVNDTSLMLGVNGSSHTTTNNTMTSPPSSSHEISLDDSCSIRISSNANNDVIMECPAGYDYSGGRHVSIVTEWDLVCGARGMAQIAQSVIFVGWLIGVIFSSAFSDKYGRKTVLTVATALCSIFEISCSFAPNLYVMILFRFFSGLFCSGLCSISFVLGAELLVSRHRETYTFLFSMAWSCFSLLLSGVAYIFRGSSWRDLQLCLGLLCGSALLFEYFIEESASWLYSRGDYKRATKIIRKACKMNKVDFDAVVRIEWERLCNSLEETKKLQLQDYIIKKDPKRHTGIVELFRIRNLRAFALIGWIVSLTNNISFFGMYLSASTLAGDLYANTALMSLLEVPGSLWVLAMLKYKGRRFVSAFFMSMAAVCLLISTISGSRLVTHTRHAAAISTAFFLLGRLAIGNSYNGIFLYLPELFPTIIRSSGTGFCVTGASIGSLLAPYLVPFHAWVSWGPGSCLILLLTISVLLLLKLPETKGKQLTSTIEYSSHDITSL